MSEDKNENHALVKSSSKDEKLWAMLAHISALCGYIIPFGNVIGPLVIWLIKKDEFALVNDQGKESINFQITVIIAFVGILMLNIIPFIGTLLSLPGMAAIAILDLILVIMAGVKANEGIEYRYPINLRLIK